MSKTLTEQWKERTLETGYYYYESKEGVRFIAFQYKGFNYPYDYSYNIVTNIKKVLARVPEYDQFADLGKKVDDLEKKLDIAVKALEEYAEKENWDDCSTGEFGSIPTLWFKSAYKNKHFGYNEAKEALEKIQSIDKQ